MTIDAERVEGAAIRALIRLLLETHNQKDVLAMMQCTVSGREVTHGQVRRQRRNMLAKGAIPRRIRKRPAVIEVAPPPAKSKREGPESFESQMARIAAGARIMAAPDFRTSGPAYTLGGVASGMCANAG
jgi:hypothetical protein